MKRLSAFLATLALALAACSGDAATPEATSTPAPTAAATPEAASTPAPTAVATPDTTPTPEAASTPEQACASGVAGVAPWWHPGLAADCEALLRAKDTLRGDASLDWGGGLAVADWEGVAVSGEPPRVTGLDLRDKGLTGSIPRELRRLRLSEVRLTGNALTGCVPSAFEDASGDAARLGLPWCLRYDRLDAAGEVASAGEWAILGGNGEVLATWEQLRSEAAALRVHQTDAGGNSWASEFGAVAVNDLFEWRLADDCWVRYRVAGAPVAPPGASGRWEFPIEWHSYAATGAGCKGAVGTGTVLRVDEAPPAVVRTSEIASPVRYGPYLLAPLGWTGDLEEPEWHGPPASAGGASAVTRSPLVDTDDLAEARRLLPYWRDPALPAGWTFSSAYAGTVYSPLIGYCAIYFNANGYYGAEICVSYKGTRPNYTPVLATDGSEVYEGRMIDGRAARVRYGLPVPTRNNGLPIRVQIFDEDTGIEYEVFGYDPGLRGSNVDSVIAIARSLLKPNEAP